MTKPLRVAINEETLAEYRARADKVFYWKLVKRSLLLGANGIAPTDDNIQSIIDEVTHSDLGEFL